MLARFPDQFSRGKKKVQNSKLLDHLVAWDGINYVHAVSNKIKSL